MTKKEVRTLESVAKDVYINVNDLMLWLYGLQPLLSSEAEVKVVGRIIQQLEKLRTQGHET